jgi:hypothetical protein
LAIIGGLALLGAGAAVATGQGAGAPPVVPLTASPNSAAVQAPGPLAAGPTTFRITRAASQRGLSVYFAVLIAGATVPELQAALAADDRSGNDSSLGLVSVQASVVLEGSATTRDVTFTLKPGLQYVVVTEPETDNGPPPSRGLTTFTTSGASNGAVAPAPDATVRMVGLRFRGNPTLPRNGTIRVQNTSSVPHIAIAFPLRRGVGTAGVGRAIRAGSERAFGRIVAGAPVTVSSIISGNAADDQQVSFTRAGRYALICFVGEHQRLGMYRVVTVR